MAGFDVRCPTCGAMRVVHGSRSIGYLMVDGVCECNCPACAGCGGKGPPELRDAGWLRERYWRDELSTRDIGRQLGCSGSSVARWMKVHEIAFRDKSDAIKLGKGKRGLRRFYAENRQMVSGDGFTDRRPGAVRHLGR